MLGFDDEDIFVSDFRSSDQSRTEQGHTTDSSESDDGSDNEIARTRLINDVSKLVQKKRVGVARKVKVLSGGSIVSGESRLEDIVNELDSAKKAKLPEPLEKPAAKRLKRKQGYDEVAKDVNKWEGLVARRRKAETLQFPLDQADIRFKTSEKHYTPKMNTELEKEVYSLLLGAKLVEDKQASEADQAVRRAMSLKEMKEMNDERWKLKLAREKMERKAARQNKSKSRRYHQILRREKLRKERTALEALQEKDPGVALEKLQELEKLRMQERMSLKHKNSKWARLQQARAKTDKAVQSSLLENARLHQELTQKLQLKSTDQEEFIPEQDLPLQNEEPAPTFENDANFSKFSKVKKFWEEVNKRKIRNQEAEATAEENLKLAHTANKKANANDDNERSDVEIDDIFDSAKNTVRDIIKQKIEELKREEDRLNDGQDSKSASAIGGDKPSEKPNIIEFDFTNKDMKISREKNTQNKQLPNLEVFMSEADDINEASKLISSSKDADDAGGTITPGKHVTRGSLAATKVQVDPTKYVQTKNKKIIGPDLNIKNLLKDSDDEEASESGDNHLLQEAFGDDYLLSEFRSEKEAAVARDTPKSVNLAMPGWGDWTGPGIKMSKNKVRKFRVKMPPPPPRKDAAKGNLIYNEKADLHKNLREKMVSDLPFPFKRVKDFEASLRAPIGPTFVPQLVHQQLTAPPVITKLGAMINPMNEDQLLNEREIKLALKKKLQEKRAKKANQKIRNEGNERIKVKARRKMSEFGRDKSKRAKKRAL